MKKMIPLLIVIILVATACGGDDDQVDVGESGTDTDTGSEPGGPGSDDAIGDTVWQLTAGVVDGADLALLDTHPVTLTSTPDGIGGTAACNSYGGTATFDGDSVTITALFQTEMACFPEETMALESAYLAALGRVMTVARDGESLILTGDGVELTFAAQAPVPDAELTGTTWLLESLIDGESVSSTVAGSEGSITIDGSGSLTGSTGCNSITATIVFDDAAWEAADVASTRMACKPDLMSQETAVLRVLSGAPTWSIESGSLTLLLADGSGLQFRAQ